MLMVTCESHYNGAISLLDDRVETNGRHGVNAWTVTMDPVAEIKRLYSAATRATIQRDLERAIELLKTLETDADRERAAVFMDGLSQMRSEWGVRPAAPHPAPGRTPGGPATPGASPTRRAKR
jgi:hypothetical protein